jgi:hypothetical protein
MSHSLLRLSKCAALCGARALCSYGCTLKEYMEFGVIERISITPGLWQ